MDLHYMEFGNELALMTDGRDVAVDDVKQLLSEYLPIWAEVSNDSTRPERVDG